MKVAVLTNYFSPEYYGSYEYYLAKTLIAQGHDVTVFTSDLKSPWGTPEKDRTTNYPLGEQVVKGIPVVRVLAGAKISFVPVMQSLKKELENRSFDVIHSNEYFSVMNYWAIKAKKNAKLIVTQHGYKGSERRVYSYVHKMCDITLGKYMLKRIDSFIALTTLAKDYLVSLDVKPEKITVIPTGVDTTLFRPEEEQQGMGNILFVGQINQNKGFDVLYQALEAIKKKDRPHLLVAGEGILKERYEDVEYIHFLGKIPHENMPHIYNGARCLVLPTVTEEPFGNVVVEAMSCGTPVIGSRIGGIAETIIDNKTGILVEPKNVKALTAAIKRICSDDKLQRKFSRASRERMIKEYDWQVIAKKTVKAYGL
jgi:glycosyltransferase involved in cell wall biosynthesis